MLFVNILCPGPHTQAPIKLLHKNISVWLCMYVYTMRWNMSNTNISNNCGHIILLYSTFPVVGPRCSKDNIMVIFGEGGGHALLTGPEAFMPPGASITEFPVSSILVWLAVDAQVLTEHVTASSDVTCLLGCVCKQQALITMGTCLREKGMTSCNRVTDELSIQATSVYIKIYTG